MKYRIFFEPMDVEAHDRYEAIGDYNRKVLKCGMIIDSDAPSIMRILPVDSDGHVIKR